MTQVVGEHNQNGNLFRDPVSGRFYLYWYRGDDSHIWKIMARRTCSAFFLTPRYLALST